MLVSVGVLIFMLFTNKSPSRPNRPLSSHDADHGEPGHVHLDDVQAFYETLVDNEHQAKMLAEAEVLRLKKALLNATQTISLLAKERDSARFNLEHDRLVQTNPDMADAKPDEVKDSQPSSSNTEVLLIILRGSFSFSDS